MARKKVYYVTSVVDSDVEYSPKLFSKKIIKTLKDPEGWESVDKIRFKYVSPKKFKEIRSKNKIFIRLSTNRTISDICGFDPKERLSCCDMLTREVFINFHRWKHGAKPSKLNIYDYREYVINHEVGHAIGRLHTGCPCMGCSAPIMMQHTISIGKCSPNSKPLKYE